MQIMLIKCKVCCKGLVLNSVGHVETHTDFPSESQKSRVLRCLSSDQDGLGPSQVRILMSLDFRGGNPRVL